MARKTQWTQPRLHTRGKATARGACLLHFLPLIELCLRYEEVLQDTPADDGFFNDPRHVGKLDAAIPDRLRINDDGGTQFALVETAGLVGPHARTELALLQFGLERAAQRFGTVGIAAAAGAARLAPVAADENMVREGGQRITLLAGRRCGASGIDAENRGDN